MEFSLADPQIWASLLTLTVLEIVLGIDNVVFISVVVSKLPAARRASVRRIGIGLALIFRILMLLGIFWIIGLTKPVVSLFDQAFSWRDIILFAGGLFLLAKATHEIHQAIEGGGEEGEFVAVAVVVGLLGGEVLEEELIAPGDGAGDL